MIKFTLGVMWDSREALRISDEANALWLICFSENRGLYRISGITDLIKANSLEKTFLDEEENLEECIL